MPDPSDWDNHKIVKPKDDDEYFERMSHVIFMAGLNWRILDKKWPGIKKAFDEFSVDKVAAYQEFEIEELMNNPDVIRNMAKIRAIIANAKQFQQIKSDKGSFAAYLAEIRNAGGEDALRSTMVKQFAFLGKGTTVIFLYAVGEDLPKAHQEWEDRHNK